MINPSFAAFKIDLDAACMTLRSFTLGKHGVTQRDGAMRIQQVSAKCDRLNELFGTGPYAKQAARIVASARTRIVAAQARLALLGKKTLALGK
jgi:hypothetical protein